jgi:hypothetical protein
MRPIFLELARSLETICKGVVVSRAHFHELHMRRQTTTEFYWDIAADGRPSEPEEHLASENAPTVVLRQIALALLVPLVLAVAASLLVR